LAPIFESNFSYESQPYWLLSEGSDPGWGTTGEGCNTVRHDATAVGRRWQRLGGALVFIRRHI